MTDNVRADGPSACSHFGQVAFSGISLLTWADGVISALLNQIKPILCNDKSFPSKHQQCSKQLKIDDLAVFSVGGLEIYYFSKSTLRGEDPSGLMIWPSATRELCKFLVAHRSCLEGHDVIELGCGLGVVGMFSARLGAQALLTDGSDDAVNTARRNIELNDLTGQVRCIRMKWSSNPDLKGYDCSLNSMLILGSELLYLRQQLEPLVKTIHSLLSQSGSSGICLLSHEVREKRLYSNFLKLASAYGLSMTVLVEAQADEGFVVRCTRVYNPVLVIGITLEQYASALDAWRVSGREESGD